MSENKHLGRGFGGKGYYIALILCAAAIGISGYLYYQNEHEPRQVSLQEPVQTVPAVLPLQEDVPAIATQTPEEASVVPPTTQAPKPQKKPLKTASPVSGQEITGYSMEALSYNQTTRDWRVHNGIDLAAEEGTEVLAAADGEVYTVYEDDSMGYTVVIRHEGGYTTKYSSLGENVSVAAGDRVELGQVIGCAGSSALVESALGSHVHFSVTYQDVPMDPAEFLSLS